MGCVGRGGLRRLWQALKTAECLEDLASWRPGDPPGMPPGGLTALPTAPSTLTAS